MIQQNLRDINLLPRLHTHARARRGEFFLIPAAESIHKSTPLRARAAQVLTKEEFVELLLERFGGNKGTHVEARVTGAA